MNAIALLILAATVTATNVTTNATDPVKTNRTARIMSATSYYDRKEGFAHFGGHVFVDDEQYQLHADRAFVFMGPSNDLQRIVALGNVAMTNGTKRAYGVKASYHKGPRMVVLYGGEGTDAEVRDESPTGAQVVRGKKIKFWTQSEQVEVLDAELSAPLGGNVKDVRNILGR